MADFDSETNSGREYFSNETIQRGNDNIRDWTTLQVVDFIRTIGFAHLEENFQTNNIDGHVLSYLNESMLDDLVGKNQRNGELLGLIRQKANDLSEQKCMIDAETLYRMVLRENEIRQAPETQARFTEAESTGATDWMEVALVLQEEVAREFGFVDNVKEAAHVLRTAKQWYPNDSRFRETPLYVKFNRAHDGPVGQMDNLRDVQLHLMDGTATSLVSLVDSFNMPVAIISGSVSWPPVRGFLPYIRECQKMYEGRITFLFIYILEAHAQDEWPISSGRYVPDKQPIIVNQHKTLQDRIDACERFVEMYNIGSEFSMCLDGMRNEFERYYGAWPLRFYGVKDGVLEFKPQPQDCTYDIAEFMLWMANATNSAE